MNRPSVSSSPAGMGWFSATPVEPQAGQWNSVPSLDPRQYVVPPPPANDSLQTREELAQLHRITQNLTATDLPRFRRWTAESNTVLTHFNEAAERLARAYGLSEPAGVRVQALLADAANTALIATWHNKYRYLRPRPTMLDSTIRNPLPVPDHPSYPAGYPAMAGAASRILQQFFPREAGTFQTMALDVGLFRLQAGAHFLSDVTAGLALGNRVAEDILRAEARTGAPMRYGV